MMLEEKLEILIITYNRSSDLENTLKQLVESPFSNCKITILDNHSTDKTPEICAKYQKIFFKMNIIRHKINIGGSVNYLRAVEYSESLYTWILCDDDLYDFSDCSDVIESINSEEFDIISVGHPGCSDWKRELKTSSKKLVDSGSKYFHTMSFLPSSIFKTKLYDANCIFNGYLNTHTLFPQFAFINKSYEEDFSIYVSKYNIVFRGENNDFFALEWLNGWISSCDIIKNKNYRRKIVYELATGSSSFTLIMLFIIIRDKSRKDNKFRKNAITLVSVFISTLGFSREILLLFLIIPTFFLPSNLCKKIIDYYLARKNSV